MISQYKPSDLVKRNSPETCYGLSAMVAAMRADGYRVLIDFEEDGFHYEEVDEGNVTYAVHELEVARLYLYKDDELKACLLVIAPNDEDWFCDWSIPKSGDIIGAYAKKYL